MKKFVIIHNAESSVEKRAVAELTKIIFDYTEVYPLCVRCNSDFNSSDYVCFYLGRRATVPYIAEHTERTLTYADEYRISVSHDSVIIEGYDDAGVLYGVLDFYNEYLVRHEQTHTQSYFINPLAADSLTEFERTSRPSVRERGLWTWGHVIYDYRGYFDNMMKLKMNSVVIWNDYLPSNAADIVEYAHSVNVKVIWGFSWLWDTQCGDVDISNLDGKSREIFEKYEREYSECHGDGIYFQTFTELSCDNIGGKLIAEAAANFINQTAELFYTKYPDLDIKFGLHATSVRDRLEFIATVDKRIEIVWEDCGAFPFSYIPSNIAEFDETLMFVNRIARLRGNDDRFGAVTKGFTNLDWSTFKHLPGAQTIGVSSASMRRDRMSQKRKVWRFIEAYWLVNADKALETVRKMRHAKNGDLCIYSLVEDGMFEEFIPYPVSLYSEMLWDCNSDLKLLMSRVALREYVDFV